MTALNHGYGLDPSHSEPHDSSDGQNLADMLQNRDYDDDTPRARIQ